MFPGNDTMFAVTGSTECHNDSGQTIGWRVGPGDSSSSAGMPLKACWLYWVSIVVIVYSFSEVCDVCWAPGSV